MSPEALILIYVVVLLGAVAGLAVYYDHRERRFRPSIQPDRVFRCDRCSYVYTDDPDTDRSRCPQCGRSNAPFEF
jgi:rubrerythrin